MNRRALSIVVLVPFLGLSLWALYEVGLVGILTTHGAPGAAQVLADLVISLLLLLTFLVPHARERGRNARVWVFLTVCLGSIGPLLYFATDREDPAKEEPG